MSVAAKTLTAAARWSATSKAKKRERGFHETTVFVHEGVRQAIDEAVASGQFKTRRAAMEHAIEAMFRRDSKATPR
jgi:hypothetical protein